MYERSDRLAPCRPGIRPVGTAACFCPGVSAPMLHHLCFRAARVRKPQHPDPANGL